EEPPKKNGQAEWSRVAPEVLRLLCGQVGLPPPEAEDFRAILGPEVIAEAPLPRGTQPLYVLTEKILGPDEPLPETWPVAGTTGYDFLTTLNGLFVEAQGWEEIVRGYKRFTDLDAAYDEVVQ